MSETVKHRITFGDIVTNETSNYIHFQNKNTSDKYIEINKNNGLINIYNGVTIGTTFDKVVLSKDVGVYIPNCAQFNNGNGYIANGKISWDNKHIYMDNDIVPLTAINKKELSKYINQHLRNIKISSHFPQKEGVKGERGEKGIDGFSIISFTDSVYNNVDNSNTILSDNIVKIPIKVLCGSVFCSIQINIKDYPKGINVYVENKGDVSEIIIEVKEGTVIDKLNSFITYDIEVGNFIFLNKGINLIFNKPTNYINQLPHIEDTNQPLNSVSIKEDTITSEPMVVIYGGGIFIEDENGEIYPKSIEFLTKTVNMENDNPEWFYKYDEKWIPIHSNNGNQNLIIYNTDSLLLKYKHLTYKVEYKNGESSVISTSFIGKNDNIINQGIFYDSNHIEASYPKLYIGTNQRDYLRYGDEVKINNINKYSIISPNSNKHSVYISSDRISKTDLPLCSTLVIGKKYIINGYLGLDFLNVEDNSDITYDIITNVISNNGHIATDSSNGMIKNNSGAKKSIPLSIPFTADDKTIRLNIILSINSSYTDKFIDFIISTEGLRCDTSNQEFNIGSFGMQYYKNPHNYFFMVNNSNGLQLSYKSTANNSSIIPIMVYGSVSYNGISLIYGEEWENVTGYWSSVKNGFIFRFVFNRDTNLKYIINISSTSNEVVSHTLRKSSKYAEVEFKCDNIPTFDFIIYSTP